MADYSEYADKKVLKVAGTTKVIADLAGAVLSPLTSTMGAVLGIRSGDTQTEKTKTESTRTENEFRMLQNEYRQLQNNYKNADRNITRHRTAISVGIVIIVLLVFIVFIRKV